MSFRRGYAGFLAYKVGGVAGGGSWVEATNVKDVTLGMSADEDDASTRASAPFKQTVSTLIDASVEFEMVWDPENPAFSAFRSAFFSKEAIGIQCLDVEGGEGLQADMEVFNMTRPEPLNGVMTTSVTLKPTYSETPPEYIEP